MTYCTNCGSDDTYKSRTNSFEDDIDGYWLFAAEDTGCSTEAYCGLELWRCNKCKAETFKSTNA